VSNVTGFNIFSAPTADFSSTSAMRIDGGRSCSSGVVNELLEQIEGG